MNRLRLGRDEPSEGRSQDRRWYVVLIQVTWQGVIPGGPDISELRNTRSRRSEMLCR